jgi:hypothetical protein
MELGMEDSVERFARPCGVGFVAADGIMGPATWELAASEVKDFRLGASTGEISSARCCRRHRLAQHGSGGVAMLVEGGSSAPTKNEEKGADKETNNAECGRPGSIDWLVVT